AFLKGLNSKQRREHYSVKDFLKLKEIPSWKDIAKKTKAKQPEEVKFPKSKDLIEKISLIRGDITKLEVDAIVNAAGGKGSIKKIVQNTEISQNPCGFLHTHKQREAIEKKEWAGWSERCMLLFIAFDLIIQRVMHQIDLILCCDFQYFITRY
ncbi:hypothetical protein GDO81_016347, partial [Engystomops pustulosus]